MPTIGSRGKKLDLMIRKGATFAPHLVKLVGKATGEPIDLTGAAIRASIRKDFNSSQKFDLDCAVVDALGGYFTMSMASEVTSEITYLGPYYEPSNQYLWDLEIEFPSGFVMPVFYGVVKLAGEATQ